MIINEERDKLFKELIARNASCTEMACNGFIKIYENNEKTCDCDDCKKLKILMNTKNLFERR